MEAVQNEPNDTLAGLPIVKFDRFRKSCLAFPVSLEFALSDHFTNLYLRYWIATFLLSKTPLESRMQSVTQFRFSSFKMLALSLAMILVGLPAVVAQVDESKSAKSAREQRDTSAYFEQVHGALENALGVFQDQEKRPKGDDLAFYDFLSKTKESQQKKVDRYLEVAAEALGISKINERRDRIMDLRKKIAASRENVATYRRKKISAPEKTYNPLVVSKSGYDGKITSETEKISEFENAIGAEKQRLVDDMKKIGMTIKPADVDILLDSITGDEFVRISIIFNNAKNFAGELERLTNESGEDLDTAKKYYGVYLMLLKSIDRMQTEFIRTVDDEYYPKLDLYAEKAREIIKQAQDAIDQGGNREILENNILNSQLTFEAAQYYKKSLTRQKYEMMKANESCKKNILTAVNTYRTAALSKELSSLIATSRRAFDSITKLSVPDLRPFENAKLKDEFSRLTKEIRK